MKEMEGQILAKLDDLKNTYLAPIKQSQDRLEERVRRQELEIDNCKETIGLVKEKIETIDSNFPTMIFCKYLEFL